LFTTHSPFLLSDLPLYNIVFLRKESGVIKVSSLSEHKQTFGANIHTLLADSFFMKEGLIGEFAKNRIQTIIDKLKPDEKKSEKDVNRDLIWKEIQIIGEPFLKEKLEEMYYSKFDKTKRINELRAELNRLEND
jgi:hypothetical protein